MTEDEALKDRDRWALAHRYPTRCAKLERVQYLVGLAKGIYLNDRAQDRAGPIQVVLDEAFDHIVTLRERCKP